MWNFSWLTGIMKLKIPLLMSLLVLAEIFARFSSYQNFNSPLDSKPLKSGLLVASWNTVYTLVK